ncbi:hypothetical protein BH23GEM7_BH23GEM7_40030 [soil metagenome]|jgi:hypothetical protein
MPRPGWSAAPEESRVRNRLAIRILRVPGYTNAPPNHWQALREKANRSQKDWDRAGKMGDGAEGNPHRPEPES